jgi:hypothetical protein
MLILRSEDLFYDLSTVYETVLDFLQLPKYAIKSQTNYNVGNYSPMSPPLKARLVEFFKPHNKKLFEYLAWDSEWE